MNYNEDLLVDYVRRTKKNLEFIEDAVRQDPEREVYEVTQLINSLLGLLVFPFEKMRTEIPRIPLSQLEEEGWIVPKVVGGFPQVNDLYSLVHYLRNAVAHFNIEFIADTNNQICGIQVCNYDFHTRKKNWEAEISIDALRNNVYRFIDIILDDHQKITHIDY